MRGNKKIIAIVLIIALLIVGVLYIYHPLQNSSPIKVGVVDSGCSESQSNLVEEAVTFTNTSYDYPSNDRSPYDSLNHGTLVCEIILDHTSDIELYSAKIAHNSGLLTYKGLFAAVNWLVSERDVEVINLSLGSTGLLNEELLSIFESFKDNVIFVTASGNTGSDGSSSEGKGDWPAILPWAVGVGSFLENESQAAFFSAKGRGYYGIATTEFSDYGYYNGKRGTSFSTPWVTAKIVNIMQILQDQKFTYTLDDVLAILARLSRYWQNGFIRNLGWSAPKDILVDSVVSILNEKICAIEGFSEIDAIPRFEDETWFLRYKVNSLNLLASDFNFQYSGNASDFIHSFNYNEHSWGTILEIKFTPNTAPSGMYSLQLENKYGNSIQYTFQLLNKSKGQILMDHRSSVNSFGHSYGEFLLMEQDLRQNGYIITHQLLDQDVDLKKYDAILSPRFLQEDLTDSGYLYRENTSKLLEEYKEYVSTGGNLLVFTGVKEDTQETIFDFLNNYGMDFGDEVIDNLNSAVSVSNFSSSPLMEGIINFEYIGQAIHATSQNVTELGWVQKSISDIFGSSYQYLSIGALANFTHGSVLALGSTYQITNESYFTDYNVYFNRFLHNYLKYIQSK